MKNFAKKGFCRYAAVLFALLLLIAAVLPPSVAASDPGYTWVSDKADILSKSTEDEIENICEEIKNGLGYNVYVATVYSLDGKTAEEYADDLYDSIFPLDSDGIMLLINTEMRDRALSTSGSAISTLYDDDRLYKIEDEVLRHLKNNDYDGAAVAFVSLTRSCLEAVKDYERDKQSDPDNAWENSYNEQINGYWVENEKSGRFASVGKKIFISLLIGVIVAFIWVSVLKSGMNTARPQSRAADYVRKGSFKLTQSSDLFLYSTVSKTPRAQDHTSGGGGGRSGGGGGGVHIGSSGASHGGSSGKF